MTLYGSNGQINTTSVPGSSYTGLHAADGSYNIVVNASSSYVGLWHACGAYNAFVVTDPSAGYYAKNGSLNVIANASSSSGFSPVQPSGVGSSAPPSWLNGADIGLNFATGQYYSNNVPVSLASLLTLTRASSATTLNSAGVVGSVSSGAPAITDTGLQTWESRTNIVLSSNDVTAAPWQTFINGSGTLTVTANSAVAPDGTTTAALINAGRTSNLDYAQVYQNFTGTAAVYSGSLWLKAAARLDIGTLVYVSLYSGAALMGTMAYPLTANWTRVQMPNTTLTASAGCQIIMGYLGNTGTQDNGIGRTMNFYAWGGQVELGSTVGPYIPTTGSPVTRAADVLTATGALSTLLASSAGSIAAWTNSSDQSGKTLVSANGIVLLGTTVGNKATTAVGATLTASNIGAWVGVNNVGFAWDGTGGKFNFLGVSTTDATARTPVAPFSIASTSGSSNFWNGNIGILLFYKTKQTTPQVALPLGVTPGFVNRYSGSPLPSTVQFRDFSGLTPANSGSPLFLQNSGAYNAEGTNSPYMSSSSKVSSTFYALTEGAIAGQADRQHQWRNINLYTGSDPLTWTPDAGNPAITASIGGLDDNFLLHPAITKDFTGGAVFTAYYSAIDTTGIWRIFYATSPTGAVGSWTKQGVAINSNGAGGYPNPGLPSLLTVGSTVYMYVVSNGDTAGTILVFTSPTSGNGSTWTFAGTALALPGATDWDANATFWCNIDPFVFKNKHGWYEMLFTSLVGLQTVGYAVSDNPLGPFVRYPSALIQTAGRTSNTGGLGQAGDGVLFEDANNYYLLWDTDNGFFNGISNPYGSTLPPY